MILQVVRTLQPTAFQEGCSDALHDTDSSDLGRRAAVLSSPAAMAGAAASPSPVHAEEPKWLVREQ